MEPNVQNSSTPSAVFVKPSKTTLSSGPNPFKRRCDTYKKYNQSPKGIERKKRYKIKQQLKKQDGELTLNVIVNDQLLFKFSKENIDSSEEEQYSSFWQDYINVGQLFIQDPDFGRHLIQFKEVKEYLSTTNSSGSTKKNSLKSSQNGGFSYSKKSSNHSSDGGPNDPTVSTPFVPSPSLSSEPILSHPQHGTFLNSGLKSEKQTSPSFYHSHLHFSSHPPSGSSLPYIVSTSSSCLQTTSPSRNSSSSVLDPNRMVPSSNSNSFLASFASSLSTIQPQSSSFPPPSLPIQLTFPSCFLDSPPLTFEHILKKNPKGEK